MNVRTRNRAGVAVGVVGLSLFAAVACTDVLQGSLQILTGPDDGFTMSPTPTSLTVQLIDQNGTRTTVAEASFPSNGLTLPQQSGSNVDIIQITGFVPDGAAVVSGATIPIALDQLSGLTLGLFMQRTGQFARLPSEDGGTAFLTAPIGTHPLLTTLYSRYVLIADGTGKTTTAQVYDTLFWDVAGQPPPLTIKPLSMAYVNNWTGLDAAADGATAVAALLTVGANNAFNWLDLTDSTSVDAEVFLDASVPFGNSLGDVAGGQTVIAGSTGITYIVGGTRASGAATNAILRISPTGLFSWAHLVYPRLGAAATYVPGEGLYVFGGTPKGDAGANAAGIELLGDGQPTAVANGSAPTDTTRGAGAVAFDDDSILLAGGVTATGAAAPVRHFSPTSLNGAPEAGAPWATLPVTFELAQAFALTSAKTEPGPSAMVVGTQSNGASSAYIVAEGRVTPVPFRQPRSNVQAVIMPNGALGVVGGDAATIESFIP